MIVVSDTSPLNYLILVDAPHVLPIMYGRVIVPGAVAEELVAVGAPKKTREWFAQKPSWLEVHEVAPTAEFPELDRGESEAIVLARDWHANLLLIDERRATTVARQREKLTTTGTLGVLLDAALMGLVDLRVALKRLQTETTFQAPEALYQEILREFERRVSLHRPPDAS